MHHEHPELVRDQYWDEVFPQELPYTAATQAFKDTHPLPSTANIAIRPQEKEIVAPLSSLKVDDMQSYVTGLDGGPIMFSARSRPNSVIRRGSQASMGTSAPGMDLRTLFKK